MSAWGRLTAFGLKIINTQVVSGVVSMEIWDVRSGRKVFGATADVTIAAVRRPQADIVRRQRPLFGLGLRS